MARCPETQLQNTFNHQIFFKNSPRLFPLGATKLKTFSLNLSVRKKAACGAGLIPELPLFGRLRLKEPERRQTVKKPPEPGRR